MKGRFFKAYSYLRGCGFFRRDFNKSRMIVSIFNFEVIFQAIFIIEKIEGVEKTHLYIWKVIKK